MDRVCAAAGTKGGSEGSVEGSGEGRGVSAEGSWKEGVRMVGAEVSLQSGRGWGVKQSLVKLVAGDVSLAGEIEG